MANEELQIHTNSRQMLAASGIGSSVLESVKSQGPVDPPLGRLAHLEVPELQGTRRGVESLDVLDLGFVRLDGSLADDLSVVNSARVSFGVRKEVVDESDVGVINFLMKNHHGTPFEHNLFRFHIKCPLFVAREWQRHRIGSFNEKSGRYSKMEAEYYVIDAKDVRTQVGKPGAYTFQPVDQELAEWAQLKIASVAETAFAAYNEMLDAGIAKEVARQPLPLNMYTEFYWSINARSLMNFLSLRTHETAQKEIRQYANAVMFFFANKMPLTFRAWDEGAGRVAP